jgi:hypothetical protein
LLGRGVGVVRVGVGVGVIECVGVGVGVVSVGVGVGAAMHPHWSSPLLPSLPSLPSPPLRPLRPSSLRVTALLAVPGPPWVAVAATAGWAAMKMAMAPAAATGPTASQA